MYESMFQFIDLRDFSFDQPYYVVQGRGEGEGTFI